MCGFGGAAAKFSASTSPFRALAVFLMLQLMLQLMLICLLCCHSPAATSRVAHCSRGPARHCWQLSAGDIRPCHACGCLSSECSYEQAPLSMSLMLCHYAEFDEVPACVHSCSECFAVYETQIQSSWAATGPLAACQDGTSAREITDFDIPGTALLAHSASWVHNRLQIVLSMGHLGRCICERILLGMHSHSQRRAVAVPDAGQWLVQKPSM